MGALKWIFCILVGIACWLALGAVSYRCTILINGYWYDEDDARLSMALGPLSLPRLFLLIAGICWPGISFLINVFNVLLRPFYYLAGSGTNPAKWNSIKKF